MVSRGPTAPQRAKPAAGDPSDLATTQAGDISLDVAVRCDPSKPDDPQQKQPTTRTVFLLISVFLSMSLVALDRNYHLNGISTLY